MPPGYTLKPDDLVGPYRLVAPLGAGGAASVFRALGPQGPVALKILHEGRASQDEVKRFRREYATLERLDHPNVVRVYDIGEADGTPWIAMELVEGADLGTVIERWQTDPPADRFTDVERIFRQLCEGLAYIHEQGVIHRDLKPQNVLVGADGRARITDFGVVKDPSAFPTNLTVVGRLIGTVAFMAPEQITGEAVDARADLYALGAILYTMLTFRRPIQADSIAGYLARHLSEAPRPPSDVVPGVPRGLERVCMRLLEKDPGRRYPSARHVLASLSGDGVGEPYALHGRNALVGRIAGRLQTFRKRGAGGVLAVLGPEGSGRSRVLGELAEQARQTGVPVSIGSIEGGVLGDLVPGPSLRPVEAIAAVRAAVVAGPRLLVVDDVDRGDARHVELLAAVVRAVLVDDALPLLIAVGGHHAARLTHPVVSGSASGLAVEELSLEPLDRDALRAMLRDRGLRGGVGAVLARRLHEELGGLPGPTLEQLDALVTAGWIHAAADGSLKSAVAVENLRHDPLPLPDRVRAAEARFLRVLEPPDRACLDALAVLDTPANLALIAPLVGLPESDVHATLAILARAGHVKVEEDGLQELYRIASRRRAQVIYESLPVDRRAALHRRAAETVQRVYRRRLNAVAEVAAHHLLKAGDPAAAYPLLLLGAQRAFRRGELPESRALCHRALEARPAAEAAMTPSEAARLRRQLYQVHGDTLRAAGRIDQAGDAYAQALLAAQTEGDRPAIGKALASLGLANFSAGRAAEAANQIEDALGILERGDPTWPEAAHALALVRFDSGQVAGAARLWEEVCETGAESRNAAAELNGLWGRALVARSERKLDLAVELLERAISRGQEGGAPEAFARVLRQRAEQCVAEGDWAAAMHIADELENLGESGAVPLCAAYVAGIRAAVFAAMGESEAAVRSARVCLEVCQVQATTELGAWAPAVRVLADSGEAAAVALRLAAPGWMPEVPYDTMALRLSLAALANMVSAPDDAVQLALEVTRRAPGPVPAAAARVDIDAAIVLARLRHADQARAVLDRALVRLDERLHRALREEALSRKTALG